MSKKICSFHGMWDNKKYKSCPKCKSVSSRTYDKSYRNQEADKFYHSRDWKNVRESIRKRDGGLCQQCKRDGRITESNVVDHIVEIKDGGDKLSLSNLECLCHPCHNRKTSSNKTHRGGRTKSLQTGSENTEPPSKLLQNPFEGGTP